LEEAYQGLNKRDLRRTNYFKNAYPTTIFL
jgi:hypothetical protein